MNKNCTEFVVHPFEKEVVPELSETELLVIRAQKIYDVIKDFIVTDEQCETLVSKVTAALEGGLETKTAHLSEVKPRQTYINELINGEEEGFFIGLFISLHKVKIAMVAKPSKKDPEFEIQQCMYLIPEALFTGDGRKLMDYLVVCLDCFLTALGLDKKNLQFSLAFVSPFPYEQRSLVDASFDSFLHHFDPEGLIGMDINKLFRRALKRQSLDLKIKCIFIINDSVGTLVAGVRTFNNCKVAVTIGLYTNAAYIERTDALGNEEDYWEDRLYTILDSEWGKYGEFGGLDFLITSIDKEMISETKEKDKWIFDKLVSGFYLGEIVRRILLKLIELETLFPDKTTEDLLTPYCLLTEDIIYIECDKPGTYKRCRSVLKKLGVGGVSDQDCSTVRYVCEIVTTRSALLVASMMVPLIRRSHEGNEIVITFDGFLYRRHPFYAHLLENKLKKILGDSAKYKLMLTEYGPQVGGGLLAASATRILCEEELEEECITEVSSSIIEPSDEKDLCQIEIKLFE